MRTLRYMLDENEFHSSYGLRSVSRVHRDKPYVFVAGHEEHRVDYVPSEGTSTSSVATPTGPARSSSRSITSSWKHSSATTISTAMS